MIVLKNNQIEVTIDTVGAQPIKVINRQENFNYIWSGEAWKRHAPILFPAIGKSNNDQYMVNGQVYSMPQHGVARDLEWEVTAQSENQVSLRLVATVRTKATYPFDFTLEVNYQVHENKLITKYIIRNNDDQIMPYALGSHPGFNIPINGEGDFTDYELKFTPHQDEIKHLGINPAPFRDGSESVFDAIKDSNLQLTHSLFDNGLIILDAAEINEIIAQSMKTTHSIKLNVSEFPYVALWTMERAKEPYLCIEPFAGLPDRASNELTDWNHKKGNNFVEPNQKQSFQYEIEFQ